MGIIDAALLGASVRADVRHRLKITPRLGPSDIFAALPGQSSKSWESRDNKNSLSLTIMISRNFSGSRPSFVDRSAESVGGVVRHRSQNSLVRACISCGIPAYSLDSVEMGPEGKDATQGRGSSDVRPLFRLWSDDCWEARVWPSLLGVQRSPITLGDALWHGGMDKQDQESFAERSAKLARMPPDLSPVEQGPGSHQPASPVPGDNR